MNPKALLRDAIAKTLSISGLSAARRKTFTIATFHRVLPTERRDEYPLPGLCVTPSELDWFLEFFGSRHTVGTLAETWARWRRGERPELPFLALTFDDAQADNFVHARHVLDRHDVKASFYAPVSHVEGDAIWHDRFGFALLGALETPDEAESVLGGRLTADEVGSWIQRAKALHPRRRAEQIEKMIALTGSEVPSWARMMSWDELRVLASEGHEIGSHSMTHALLPQVDDAQLERELVESKRRLEAELGTTVSTFCYPNGDNDARVRRAVKSAGYVCAVSTRWGQNHDGDDVFNLRRCDIQPFHARDRSGALSTERLAMRISGLQPGL